MKSRSLLLINRLIALFVCFCFSANSILLAAPEILPNLTSKIVVNQPFGISIPVEYGKVDEINLPDECLSSQKNCSFVVYLQDAHANLGAQKSIQNIIKSLAKTHHIQTILTEGASGEADLKAVRDYPSEHAKKLTTEFFLREVVLTGMEAEAILSDTAYKVIGIENKDLYEKNVVQFNQALEASQPELSKLNELIRTNTDARSDYDNDDLKEFENKITTFEKRSELIPLISYLANRGRELGVKRSDLSHIEKLISLVLLERSLTTENRSNSSQSETRKQFERLSKEIGALELFQEIDELKSRIRAKLFISRQEESRFRESRSLKILKSILSLQATPKDVSDFERERKDISIFSEQSQLSRDAIDTAYAFYETSVQREESFLQNVRAQLSENKKIFLVTGGFHADRLGERFRREQIPFVVISPAVSPETDFERYYERLRGEKISFEKFETKFKEFLKSSAILFRPEIFNPDFPGTALQFFDAVVVTQKGQKSDSHQLNLRSELRQIDRFGIGSASRATRVSSELRAKRAEQMDFKDLDQLRKAFTREQTVRVAVGEKFSLAADGIDSPEILNVFVKSLDLQRIQIIPKSYDWILVRNSNYTDGDSKKIIGLFKTAFGKSEGLWLSENENSVLIAQKRSGKIVIIGEIIFSKESFGPDKIKTIQIKTIPGVHAFPHHKRLTYPTSLLRLFSRLSEILKRNDLIQKLEQKEDGMWIAVTHLLQESLRNGVLFDALAKLLVINLSAPQLRLYFIEILDFIKSAVKDLIITEFEDPYYRAVIKGNLMWFLMDYLQPAVSALQPKFNEAKDLNKHVIEFARHILQTYYDEHIHRAQMILMNPESKKNLNELKNVIYHLKKAGKYLDRIKKYYSRFGRANQFQSEERLLAKLWAITNSQFRDLSRAANGSDREIVSLVKMSKKERIHRFEQAMREGGRTPYDVNIEELIGLSIAEDLNSSRHFIIRALSRLVNKNSLLDILIGDSGASKADIAEGVDILADRRTPLSVMLALTKLGTQGKRLGTRLYQVIRDHVTDGRRQPIIDVLANEIRSVYQTDEKGNPLTAANGKIVLFQDSDGNPVPGSNSYDAHILKMVIIKLEHDIRTNPKWNYDQRIAAVLKRYSEIINLRMPEGANQYKPFEPDPELIVHLLVHADVFQGTVGLKPLQEALRHILELNIFGEIREEKTRVAKEDMKELFDKNHWFSESKMRKEGRDILRTIFILTGFLDASEQYRDIVPEVVKKVDAVSAPAVVFQEWPSHYTPVQEARFVAQQVGKYLDPNSDDFKNLSLTGLPEYYKYPDRVRQKELHKHLNQKVWFLKVLSMVVGDVRKRSGSIRKQHFNTASKTRGKVSEEMREVTSQVLAEIFERETLGLLSKPEQDYLLAMERATSGKGDASQRNNDIEEKALDIRRCFEDLFNHFMPQLVSIAASSKQTNTDEERFPSPSAEQVIRAFHIIKPGVPVVDVHMTILPKQGASTRESINVTATRMAREMLKDIPIQVINWRQIVSQSRLAPVNQLADPEAFDFTEPVMFLNVEVETEKIKPLPKEEFLEAFLGAFFMSYAATIRGHAGKASDWDPHQIYDHMLITSLKPEDVKLGEEKIKEFLDNFSKKWTETPIVVLFGRHRPLEPTRKILDKHYLRKNKKTNESRSELRMTLFSALEEIYLKGGKNQVRSVFSGTAMNFRTEDFFEAAYSLDSQWDTEAETKDRMRIEYNQFRDAVNLELADLARSDRRLAQILSNASRETLHDIWAYRRSASYMFDKKIRDQIAQFKQINPNDPLIAKLKEIRKRVLKQAPLKPDQVRREMKFFASVVAAHIADYETRIAEFASPRSDEARALRAFIVTLQNESKKILRLIKIEKRSAVSLLTDYLNPDAIKNLEELDIEPPKYAKDFDSLRKLATGENANNPLYANMVAQMNETINTFNYLLASLRHAADFSKIAKTHLENRKSRQTQLLAQAFHKLFDALPAQDTLAPGSDDAKITLYLYQLQDAVMDKMLTYETYAEIALQMAARDILKQIRKDETNLRARFKRKMIELHKDIQRKIAPQPQFLKVPNLVVVADHVTTLHFIELQNAYPNLKAVLTWKGTPAEHWAAVAATSSGIVAITSINRFSDGQFETPNFKDVEVKSGASVYIDGNQGIAVINPSKTTVTQFENRRLDEIAMSRLVSEFSDKPVMASQDGLPSISIKVGGVVSSIKDVMASENGDDQKKVSVETVAESIRLWRTEYTNIPKKLDGIDNYQERFKNELVKAAEVMPDGIVVRLLDLSPDKAKELGVSTQQKYGIDFYQTELGRAIVMAQMRAILEAHLELWGKSAGPISLLIPMIRNEEDIKTIYEMWNPVRQEFIDAGKLKTTKINPVPIGFMVETKEMVANLETILDRWKPDFLSIGTNDYTREFTGAERASGHLAYLQSDPELWANIEHAIVRPAVARKIPVCVCGDLAGWRRFTLFWVNLAGRLKKEGFEPELSLAVQATALAHIKHFIRFVKFEDSVIDGNDIFGDYENLRVQSEKSHFDKLLGKWRLRVEESIKNTDQFRRIRAQVAREESVRSELRHNQIGRYFIHHKLKGTTSTSKREPHAPFVPTVYESLPPVLQNNPGLQLLGRLDKNTTGLTIFGSNKALNHYLFDPKTGIERTYEVFVSGEITDEKLERLKAGVKIVIHKDGKSNGTYVAKPKLLELVRRNSERTFIRLTLTEGKYHEIKKMFAAIGFRVTKLRRISFGAIKLGNLKEGETRELTDAEYEWLVQKNDEMNARRSELRRVDSVTTDVISNGASTVLQRNNIAGKIVVSVSELENQPALVAAIKKSITENPDSPVAIAIVAERFATGVEAEPDVQRLFGGFDIFGKKSGTTQKPRAQLYARDRLGIARELSAEQAYSKLVDIAKAELSLGSELTTRIVAIGGHSLLTDVKQKIAKIVSEGGSLMLAELLIASDDSGQYLKFADEFGIVSPTAALVDVLVNTILEKALIESAA